MSYNKPHVNHTRLLLRLIRSRARVNWSKEGFIICQIGKEIRSSCSQARLILSTQRTWLLQKRGFPSQVQRNMSPKAGKTLFWELSFSAKEGPLYCFRWNNLLLHNNVNSETLLFIYEYYRFLILKNNSNTSLKTHARTQLYIKISF